MAPQPMTPEQRNALRAQFARMFDPAAQRPKFSRDPRWRDGLIDRAGDAAALANPAPLPLPGEAATLAAGAVPPPIPPVNVGIPMLPPARPQLSGPIAYRDAEGSAGPGAVEQGYQRDLAAQVPVRKVTIGAPPPPAPPTLPTGAPPPASVPSPDVVRMKDEQKTVQGVSGIKVPKEVAELQERAHAAETEAADATELAALEQQQALQASQSEVEAAYKPHFGALEQQAADLQQEMQQAKARKVELDQQAAQLRAVDPNRWWSNQTALQRTLLAVGSVAGGFLEGFTMGRARNDIPDRIERAIARDTDAQVRQWEMAKSDAEAQQTTVGKLVSLYGSLGEARGALIKAKSADLASAAHRIAESTTDAGARAKGLLLKAGADKALAKSTMENAEASQGRTTFTKTTGTRDQFAPGAGKGPGEGQGELKQGELSELSQLDSGIAYAATNAPIILAQITASDAKTFGEYLRAKIGTTKEWKDEENRQQVADRWTFKNVMGMGGEQGSGSHFAPREFYAAGGETPQTADPMPIAARKMYGMLGIKAELLMKKAEDKALRGDRVAAEMYARRVRDVGKIVEGLERDFFKGAYAADVKRTGRQPISPAWAPGTIEGRLADAERRRAQLLGGR